MGQVRQRAWAHGGAGAAVGGLEGWLGRSWPQVTNMLPLEELPRVWDQQAQGRGDGARVWRGCWGCPRGCEPGLKGACGAPRWALLAFPGCDSSSWRSPGAGTRLWSLGCEGCL